MAKALVIENNVGEAERLSRILAEEALEVVVRQSGREVQNTLDTHDQLFGLALLSAQIPGPPFSTELIGLCRRAQPQMRVIVISGTLDVSLAARATALGAHDFLERPVDESRLRFCIRESLQEKDPLLPVIHQLREIHLGEHGERLIGSSPIFLDTLRQIARLTPHDDSRVLILGESGTGKELLAKAIHRLGPRAARPWIAVNIGETPNTLVESSLFGHERGAFTDARELRQGLLELARDGTLFLDEIGDLEMQLQGKLLRVIQERQFRRLGGSSTLHFDARLICATNRDLAHAVQHGTFRRDLYHRIAEVVVQVPPLRMRYGDIDELLRYFLQAYSRMHHLLQFAPETLTILRSYPFPGNVRELENLVKGALIQADSGMILPRHLPLATMNEFLASLSENDIDKELNVSHSLTELFAMLQASMPANWLELPYRDAAQAFVSVFDRVYLQNKLHSSKHNITRAASSACLDSKTFRKHWKECGLPPLTASEE